MASIPSSGGQGSAMSYAASATINSGFSNTSVSSGTVNYTDAGSSDDANNGHSLSRFINPLKKKEITKVLNIDSRFRDNYYSTTSTDYNVKLPLSFEKVIQMELMHIELPLTFYGVTKEKGNNYFWIKFDGLSSTDDDEFVQVEIPDGNYSSSTITTVIDDAIASFITNYTSLNSDDSNAEITINTVIDEYTNKFHFVVNNFDSTRFGSYEINFSCPYLEEFDDTDKQRDTYNTTDGTSLQLKLGWSLGYRFSKYISSSSTYEGEAPFENPLPRYLYIAIDDYNNNVNNCIFSAFNSSILNKNILAKLGYFGNAYEIYKAYKVDDGQHFRNYFGPVTIRKLSIKIIDEFGRQVDLNNMDFSFGLALTCQYD
tara:strand:- start:519 stop:1631 length:1113 start_codon:yes stop_codon:yes gene_type:complete